MQYLQVRFWIELRMSVTGRSYTQKFSILLFKQPPMSMVPYRSASKINQSEMALEYFEPLQTHKYHTHTYTPCLMMGEVSLETSPKKHYDSRHDKLKNSMNTTESTNTNIFKIIIQAVLSCKLMKKFAVTDEKIFNVYKAFDCKK